VNIADDAINSHSIWVIAAKVKVITLASLASFNLRQAPFSFDVRSECEGEFSLAEQHYLPLLLTSNPFY
jgi:hypothetical protein